MAVQWEVPVNSTQEWRILPEHIKVTSALDRHVLPDIEWLIRDIEKYGQHTPCGIRKDGGSPVLVTGRSRWRALLEINKRRKAEKKEPIPLRCNYMQISEEDAYRVAISENHQRNALDPLDYAYQIKYLGNVCAMTEEQIALVYYPDAEGETLKDAIRFVRKHAKLINLSKAAEKAMREGTLKESAAYKLAKMSADEQKEVLESGAKPAKKKPAKPSLKEKIAEVVKEQSIFVDGKYSPLSPECLTWLRSLIQ
jgi:ParB-like chromosome segregation protein Spo0J